MKARAFRNFIAWAAVVLLSNSPVAEACSVCFGKSDSKLAEGLNWGIFTLLGVVMLVLTTFGVFAYYLAKRASLNPIPIPPQSGGENEFPT